MNIPVWVSEAAADFWQAVGRPEPFPRALWRSILGSPFDLTVKEIPALSLRGVERYLAGLGVGWRCGDLDRPLRACLAACDGAGFIFLDASDAPAERTFSLAHELAHFLGHYWRPRQQACHRLGEGTADVVDGKRAPTPAERARAALAGISIGLHIHLMQRGPRRVVLSEAVAVAEEEADRLAYELLAPAAAVAARVGPRSGRAQVAEVLQHDFGLSPARAAEYAEILVPWPVVHPLLRRLSDAFRAP
ncbi:MAG: ImmA/IrrE family metallo-endopeptidase [Gemmataceae bacterium]|nr:ImmA/IrrE family metallo-endopeptidase [Gemmataceae bacterium]